MGDTTTELLIWLGANWSARRSLVVGDQRLITVSAFGLTATVLHDLFWYEPQSSEHQAGDDDSVIEVSQHRDEVWNQIERHKGVGDRRRKQPSSETWCTRVGDHEPVDGQLSFELPSDFSETHAGQLGIPSVCWCQFLNEAHEMLIPRKVAG